MQDKHLEQVLEQVRASRAEAQRFASDPEAYLKSKGVKTDNLKFNQGAALSEAELEQVAGGRSETNGICGSVGCIACITAGDNQRY